MMRPIFWHVICTFTCEETTMLTSAKDFIRYRVTTRDGDVGLVRDIYIKDDVWAVRFLVVGPRRYLPARSVLVNPLATEWVDPLRKRVLTTLSRADLRQRPKAYQKTTVSERKRNALFARTMVNGPIAAPLGFGGFAGVRHDGIFVASPRAETPDFQSERLRSIKNILRYQVVQGNETLGELDDFLLEDSFWILRYMVVKTPDKRKILIATDMIEKVSWFNNSLSVGITKAEAKRAPEYDARRLKELNKEGISEVSSF